MSMGTQMVVLWMKLKLLSELLVKVMLVKVKVKV